MSKRSIAILVLLAVVGFYAFGTGFDFFYRFFYSLILLLSLGLVWSWMGLRGIDLDLYRTATRGTVSPPTTAGMGWSSGCGSVAPRSSGECSRISMPMGCQTSYRASYRAPSFRACFRR